MRYLAIVNHHLMVSVEASSFEDAENQIREDTVFIDDLKILSPDRPGDLTVKDLFLYQTISLSELIDLDNMIYESKRMLDFSTERVKRRHEALGSKSDKKLVYALRAALIQQKAQRAIYRMNCKTMNYIPCE